ncbi:hypothetical protein [Limnohabitans parvus]|uniref:Uncharacterized protein n=1 Tax=Limnohabitans parvus II-B4 TaxID=1293052 RepID=A0A315EFH9_9BURK|nr:hypothetical protein [Limnohabitans parvus]PUE55355.1 hypothetical protein B9Z37_01935 [Limnohabitans parvus II-B4]
MTEPWTQDEALLLQQLRQGAGLDTSRFAIENAISHAQLLQLENGGDSLFYSAAIKAHLGRQLIAKLQKRLDSAI